MARTLDEMLTQVTPEVRAKAEKKAEEILLDIHLAKLREKLQMTQAQMAAALGVKQPTISDLEKPGRDMKLSSLKRYVEASGAKLRLDVELPDGNHYEITL